MYQHASILTFPLEKDAVELSVPFPKKMRAARLRPEGNGRAAETSEKVDRPDKNSQKVDAKVVILGKG